jgi:hypothetical protein
MKCSGCQARGVHSVVGAEDGKPVVLVASDQNFPPVLFSKDGDACVGIMRIEFGTAKELGFAVADLLHGISLPVGSVILVGSISDLNRQGIGGYTDELARTVRVLKDKLGGRVKVVALPPVLLGGINSFRLLRLVVEVEHWAERLEGGDGVLLKKTRGEVVNKIGEHRVGGVKDPEEKVDTLLREVEGWKKMRVRSVAWSNMPERMKPLSEEGEKVVLDQLWMELRQNFGVRVSGNLDLSREGAVEKPVFKYAVLGGSNADRLGDAMVAMGKDVIKVTKSGWRPSKKGVEEMMQMLVGKDLGDRIIILYGMDNGVFYEEDEDGDRSLPKPDDKGKYHVVGKVEVATQKQAKGLFCNCLTILDRVKGCRKLLMAPGVRYFREACCVKDGHCSNLGESGYRRGMLEDLSRIKEAMDEVCREAGMKSFKVLSPVELLGIRPGMDEDTLISIVGDDPVHMAAQGYAKLAVSCINLAESNMTIFTGEKRGWEDEEDEEEMATQNYHRKRHEWLFNVVSGTGSWKGGQAAPPAMLSMQGGQEKGFPKGTWKGLPGKGAGPKGGNAYPYFK